MRAQGIGLTCYSGQDVSAFPQRPTFHVAQEATLPYIERNKAQKSYTRMVAMARFKERIMPKGLGEVSRVPII